MSNEARVQTGDATTSKDTTAMTANRDRHDLTPRDALERWLDKMSVDHAESTISSYQYRLKHFVEFCEREGISPIRELSGWDIESYETERRATTKVLTLNRELNTLQNFLEYCERIEILPEGVHEKVDPPNYTHSDQVDETRLHADDADALLAYYQNSTEERYSRGHALLAIAWYTGARSGAIRSLDLSDYHPEEEYLEFRHRPDTGTTLKNGREGERMVGIPEVLVEILDGYLREHRLEKYDAHGREPLLPSEMGRVSQNGIRAWMYLATVPCLHSACPHGNEPDTCDFLEYSTASQCPSSRSPHQVRTGSITWQLNRGVPIEVVAARVNTSVRVLKKHYDKPSKREELEERRREHLHRLDFATKEDEA